MKNSWSQESNYLKVLFNIRFFIYLTILSQIRWQFWTHIDGRIWSAELAFFWELEIINKRGGFPRARLTCETCRGVPLVFSLAAESIGCFSTGVRTLPPMTTTIHIPSTTLSRLQRFLKVGRTSRCRLPPPPPGHRHQGYRGHRHHAYLDRSQPLSLWP